MTAAPFPSVAQINGVAATSDALAALAFAGHAHFTAMQVRDGHVRGLDLHLARLRDASALFGGPCRRPDSHAPARRARAPRRRRCR